MEPKKKNNTSKGVKSGVCAGAKTDKTKVSCYFMPHTLAEVNHIYKSDKNYEGEHKRKNSNAHDQGSCRSR